MHITCIFYEYLTIETLQLCSCCVVSAGRASSPSRQPRGARNERQASGERAGKSQAGGAFGRCASVGRCRGGKQPPSAAAAGEAGGRDLRPASVGGSPPVVRPLRAVVSLFVALSSPLLPLRARRAASVGIGYAVPPVGHGSARSGL